MCAVEKMLKTKDFNDKMKETNLNDLVNYNMPYATYLLVF